MKNLSQKLFVLLLSTSTLLWLGFLAVSQAFRDESSEVVSSVSLIPVETTEVQKVDSYQISRIYTGTVVPRRSSELGFERIGTLKRIVVEEGDEVNAGMPLAYLDTRSLGAQQRKLLAQKEQAFAQLKELEVGFRPEEIAAAEATVREVKAQLQLAKIRNQRRQQLYAEGAISKEQLDEAMNAQAVLQSRLARSQSRLDELLAGTRSERIEAQKAVIRQLEADLDNLQIQLKKSVLKAPFDGTVSKRLVDEGTVFSGLLTGKPILKLVEDNVLEIHIGVTVDSAAQLQVGNSLSVQVGQKNYKVQVTSILPELESDTRTSTVILTLNPTAASIQPGQTAQLKLTETVSALGYWLPNTALTKGERGLWSTYILREAKDTKSAQEGFRVERRDVEVLHTESDRVFVRGTLQDGDYVVVGGNHRFAPGQLVRLANP